MTVIDEEDEDPWVNVVISVEEGYGRPLCRDMIHRELTVYRTLGGDEPPYKSSDAANPAIPRKPKKEAPAEANGHLTENGAPKGVKRPHPDDEVQPTKKAKVAESTDDDVVLVEDVDGAIVIGDD